MSFVDEQDQLMQKAIVQLQDLNNGVDIVLLARNAVVACKGKIYLATQALMKSGIKLSSEESQERRSPIRAIFVPLPVLHYTSHHQIHAVLQSAFVTLFTLGACPIS